MNSAYAVAVRDVAAENPAFSALQCRHAAYELLAKRVKIGRRPDAHGRLSVTAPDGTAVGYIADSERTAPVMVRGTRYAAGHEKWREWRSWSADGRELYKTRYKKDAIIDLLRDAYREEERAMSESRSLLLSLVSEAADEIFRSGGSVVIDDGAFGQLVATPITHRHAQREQQMKITVTELKRLVNAAIIEVKAPVKFSQEKIKILQDSLRGLTSVIAGLESAGFWDEFLRDDALEPDNSSEIWDEKIDAVDMMLDARDYAAAAAVMPTILSATQAAIEIIRRNRDELDDGENLLLAKKTARTVSSFMTNYEKMSAAATAPDTNG